MKKSLRWCIAMTLTTACFACGSTKDASTPTPSLRAEVNSASPGMVSRTIVQRDANGVDHVTQDMITVEEQASEAQVFNARHDALERGDRIPESSVVHDTSCGSSDIMIWDESGYTGDEICFYISGSGGANTYLPNYLATCVFGHCYYWAGADVISYKTNSQYGCFCSSGSTTICATSWNFGTSQSDTNTFGEVSGADYLWLDVTGCGTSSPTH